ncbi:hypothetical protein EYV94_03275 [Puteibacter caeruleilacunae]|nr:hypothetical protein EYV94_03275 [Puteibacter caeruleilacunae]
MKSNLFKSILVLAVFMFGTAMVNAQSIDQNTTINAKHSYWVNSSDGAQGTHDASEHADNTYDWQVYQWDGSADYSSDSWTATVATGSFSFDFTPYTNSNGTANAFRTDVTWLAAGDYVLEVKETDQEGCITIRRFGIRILDLDLLLVMKDGDGAELTTDASNCNTDNEIILGSSTTDDNDVNSYGLQTMTFTYEVSLSTVKGSTDSADAFATKFATGKWKFDFNLTGSAYPTAPTEASATWSIVNDGDVTGSITDNDGSNEIEVNAGVETVTIQVILQNIAADEAQLYTLAAAIAPSTVNVELGGASATDYAEGTEPSTYDGVADAASNKNGTPTISVKPIPNTSKISFQ